MDWRAGKELYEGIQVATLARYIADNPPWTLESTVEENGNEAHKASCRVKGKTIMLGFTHSAAMKANRPEPEIEDEIRKLHEALKGAMAQCCALAYLGLPVPGIGDLMP